MLILQLSPLKQKIKENKRDRKDLFVNYITFTWKLLNYRQNVNKSQMLMVKRCFVYNLSSFFLVFVQNDMFLCIYGKENKVICPYIPLQAWQQFASIQLFIVLHFPFAAHRLQSNPSRLHVAPSTSCKNFPGGNKNIYGVALDGGKLNKSYFPHIEISLTVTSIFLVLKNISYCHLMVRSDMIFVSSLG